MSIISKFSKGIKYLYCVIDLLSRFAWVIGIKDKKGTSIVNGFQKIVDNSKRKPNKIWVDHGSEFYNKAFKDFLKRNDRVMYFAFNEGKSVVAERFIKTLKNKIYKHMTTAGKNVYFNALDDIVGKYNNTYHSSIKIKMLLMILLLSTVKNFMKKILNLKLVTMSEFRGIKIFLPRVIHQIGVKKSLFLRN